MACEIPLTKGQVALVDEADYAEISQHKWHVIKGRHGHFYAARKVRINGKGTSLLMHRAIMDAPPDMQVDHKNEYETLNNQRYNLRLATHGQNQMNTGKHSHNTSGYKWISWAKARGKYRGRVVVNKQEYAVGYFDDPAEGYAACYEKAKELHGKFVHF